MQNLAVKPSRFPSGLANLAFIKATSRLLEDVRLFRREQLELRHEIIGQSAVGQVFTVQPRQASRQFSGAVLTDMSTLHGRLSGLKEFWKTIEAKMTSIATVTTSLATAFLAVHAKMTNNTVHDTKILSAATVFAAAAGILLIAIEVVRGQIFNLSEAFYNSATVVHAGIARSPGTKTSDTKLN